MADYSSNKLSALVLIYMLFVSSITPILACGTCKTPPKVKRPKRPIFPPPVNPPVTPTIPPVTPTIPPVTPIIPPVTPILPPLPPIIPPLIPIIPPLIPIINPPLTPIPTPATPATPRRPSRKVKPGCPPPPAAPATCPIDTLKLGSCVDLLGGLVHVIAGDPVVSKCCPILKGLVGMEAAVCLCTTIKFKLLNVKLVLPIALELLVTCGKTPPPGYTCTI